MTRKWWTLTAVSIATFMLLLDITVVNTALPSIRDDLGASFSDLQWVVDAYVLSLAAVVLTAGSVADRIGRKRVFVAGLAIFSVASLVIALSSSIEVLIGARALQGIGGGAVVAPSLPPVPPGFEPGPAPAPGGGGPRAAARAAPAGGPAG